MSLRIKIPAANPQPTMERQEQPAKRKRKPNKRYINSDDDELEAESNPTRSLATGQQPAAEVARAPSFELDIDVLNDPWDDAQLQANDHHLEHSGPRITAKTKGKANADGAPARKKPRKVVVSEPESEEDCGDTAPDHDIAPDDGDDDDNYISPDEKTPKSLKGKTKGQPNKSSAAAQGKKRKALGRPTEHHGPVSSSAAPRKKQKLAKPDDPYLNVVGEEPATSEISAPVDAISPAPKQDSPAPTLPPKKPKLPTIKKTKLIGSSSGLNTPTSATVPIKKPLDLPINTKLSHDGVRKTLMGKTDIDLSNKSVYQEIFLKTGSGGGGTPGRTKEEERRKELNRMRDEAKAKRAAEAEHLFDLQAQFDKISHFEDRLRQGRSSVLYPNFMAAKWREVYDRGKRKQQEQEWNGGREEGEVT